MTTLKQYQCNYKSIITKLNEYVNDLQGLTPSQKETRGIRVGLAFHILVELQLRHTRPRHNTRIYKIGISSELAKELFGKTYTELIQAMVDTGILSLRDNHCAGRNCRGYSVDLTNHEKEPVWLINDEHVHFKKKIYDNKETNRMHMAIKRNDLLEYMKPTIFNIELTPSSIPMEILGEYPLQIKEFCTWKSPTEKTYAKKAAFLVMNKDMSQWIPPTNSPRFSLSQNGNRIYHTYTCCPKTMKSFIKIDGENIVQFDIRSCHPFFSFVATGNQEFLNLYHTKDIYQEAVNFKFKGKDVPVDARQIVKEEWSAWLNNHTGYDYEIGEWFLQEYPAYYYAIKQFKKEMGKTLYLKWVEMENQLIKKTIYPLLIERNVKFIDAHDGFDVPESQTRLVLEALEVYKANNDINSIPDFKYGNPLVGIPEEKWMPALSETQSPLAGATVALEATVASESIQEPIQQLEAIVEAPVSLEDIMEDDMNDDMIFPLKKIQGDLRWLWNNISHDTPTHVVITVLRKANEELNNTDKFESLLAKIAITGWTNLKMFQRKESKE